MGANEFHVLDSSDIPSSTISNMRSCSAWTVRSAAPTAVSARNMNPNEKKNIKYDHIERIRAPTSIARKKPKFTVAVFMLVMIGSI